VNLRTLIEELPGRLSANVTDDDRRSIAEHVHGLFESSGAFTKGEDPAEKEDKEDPVKEGEDEPQQADSLARRLFGRH
jgi:hypothetical protein